MMRIVVAGASGFVGQALGKVLGPKVDLIGLTRTAREPGGGFSAYRRCDLFSQGDAMAALEGADAAVYLVHSMMPSARLTQASFEDLDLLCAQNFANAARACGVKRIIYLGGLLPADGKLSPHLRSRQEVARVLAGSGAKVVTLRAGLILGAGGSSFQILSNLVKNLPMMLCPSWTSTPTQPVAIADVVTAIERAVLDEEVQAGGYDLGVPQRTDYLSLMRQCAECLGVKRRFWSVPVLSPRLSRRWVCLTTGAPMALVSPLVESLLEPMLVDERVRFPLGRPPMTLVDGLNRALEGHQTQKPQRALAFEGARRLRKQSLVRSVQRMQLAPGRGALWAAREYLRWLPGHLRGLIQVRELGDGIARFVLAPFGITLLKLRHAPERSTDDRQLFYITGGVLAQPGGKGRFELRTVSPGGMLLTAVHDFAPRLPWWIYRYTQAVFHQHVMRRFASHLANDRAASLPEMPR